MIDSITTINELKKFLKCDTCLYAGQSESYCSCTIKRAICLIESQAEKIEIQDFIIKNHIIMN